MASLSWMVVAEVNAKRMVKMQRNIGEEEFSQGQLSRYPWFAISVLILFSCANNVIYHDYINQPIIKHVISREMKNS